MRLKPPCHQLAHCYANPQDILAADRQLLNRPISNSNALPKSNCFAAYAAHIVALLKSASNGSILSATSLTRQFPPLHPLILTFVFHKLYSQILRRSCACQNGPGPAGRVNSLISNEVRRAIDFHQEYTALIQIFMLNSLLVEFINIFDKGYRCISAALLAGGQKCLQPSVLKAIKDIAAMKSSTWEQLRQPGPVTNDLSTCKYLVVSVRNPQEANI